jgi:RNA polymerase sigma-70 factor (ECF subfamily)
VRDIFPRRGRQRRSTDIPDTTGATTGSGSGSGTGSGHVTDPEPRQSARDAAVTDLALRAARGDRRALTDFIEATHGDVWRLLAHLADTDRADDLTQETYLRVMGALPRFAARSSARTWLLSLAHRVWVDSVRHDLAPERREALILTQVLGYTYAEAAEICDVRVGTIRSRVARARADMTDMAEPADTTGTGGTTGTAPGPRRPGGHLREA